ncbi:hypothetical protein F5884DRAFT_23682 [Xylogone sp. PMI_703]|nr:hypothetical protein F5884DRAFT_23682 [Xylogone sp. PMI_703]
MTDDIEYLSDESDFYGDDNTKRNLELRASSFDALQWWKSKSSSLTEIANSNVEAELGKKAAPKYNIYEGLLCGRQLSETVDEFLRRLPPSTTLQSISIPWIFISNPYVPRYGKQVLPSESSANETITEAPPEPESDVARFREIGQALLEELTVLRKKVERQKAGQPHFAINKAVNVQKTQIVERILKAAQETRVRSGKWMLFCSDSEVDAVWSIVARHTAEDQLGTGAKVSPRDPNANRGVARVICIYTKNFSDQEDIRRVIRKLRDLGLVETKGRPIYYKPGKQNNPTRKTNAYL